MEMMVVSMNNLLIVKEIVADVFAVFDVCADMPNDHLDPEDAVIFPSLRQAILYCQTVEYEYGPLFVFLKE